MPRNGTGGYSLPNNSWNPAINGAAATAADWQTLINDVATAIQNSVSADGQTTMTGSLNMGGFVVASLGAPSGTGQSLRWEQLTKGADIASAAALPVPVEGSVFSVTGTTTITSIVDVYPGRIVYLIFPAGITITNSSGLILPGGVNVVTKANDVIAFLNESPGVWRAISFPARLDTATGIIPTGGYKNVLVNGNFNVNQRAVSGAVVLAAGAFGHDRWKAGSGGCTYTFSTSAGVTTLTITAGTLVQTIEGNNLKSGTYTLSWTGTAQGKIGAGVFSPTGVTGAAIGGTNLNIEFGTGTLALAQFEFGSNATLFEYRPVAAEMDLCIWYAEVLNSSVGNRAYASLQAVSTTVAEGPLYYRKKRAAPSITTSGAIAVTAVGGGAVGLTTLTFTQIYDSGANIVATANSAALVAGNASLLRGNAANAVITISAEL
jgi:hypothetical protein